MAASGEPMAGLPQSGLAGANRSLMWP